jgi:hypothetical protein
MPVSIMTKHESVTSVNDPVLADGDGSHEECGHVDVVFIFISLVIS